LYAAPAHPYTRGLLASLPSVDGGRERLVPISGQVPPIGADVTCCPFADRCAQAMAECHQRMPAITALGGGHEVACFLHSAAVAVPA
jgi:oligopeptide/dipeptide ABC transporter ATP-binding protein